MSQARAAQAQGAAAFRAGAPAAARDHFEQARRLFAATLGEDAPETLEALSDSGAASAAMGAHDAARAAHAAVLAARRRVLGAAHPSVGTSLHNLGAVLRAQGEIAAAEACHLEGLAIWRASLGEAHPILAKSLAALGVIARARGDAAAALHYAEQSLSIRRQNVPGADPQMAMAFDDLAHAFALAGNDDQALAAWRSALDVLGAHTPRAAPVLNNLGVTCRSLGALAAARDWFAAAVAVAPDLAIARHNLAACHARLGEREEARRQRERALAQQSVFVQNATRPGMPRVLIPALSDEGNVPLEHILPARDFTRIWWFIGHGPPATLPPFDLVFNGIGDPDMWDSSGAALQGFLHTCTAPVFNRADAVGLTRRDVLPRMLAGIAGLVVPPICRLDATGSDAPVRRRAGQADVAPPLLLRPAGSHGGVGLRRLDGWDAFEATWLSTAPAWYLSSFIDTRSTDGFYRKYRMAFVDRRPYPYHLAISPDWLVHYVSADMPAHSWKLAEEAAFLADPCKALGATAYDAIAEAGLRLDLDFCGIDFTVLPDGRALVFEANATMLIHPENMAGALAFKNDAVGRIVDAFGAHVRQAVLF